MQTISTAIRQERTRQAIEEGRAAYAARQAQVAAIAEAIVRDGQPELHADSTALCSHFKLRKGEISGEQAEAQVYTHEVGIVIRFWIYGKNFDVRTRDLILLALPAGEKGYEVWLDDGAKLFPHEGGKYALAGQSILSNMMSGR